MQDLTTLGEYRPITIVFVDLVGSTRIARGYPHEQGREIILNFRRVVQEAVNRYDGHTARAFGDGLLIGFGHPRAHEDDAERALRAAQDIHAGLKTLSASDGIDYRTHIGIATDMVLIGDEAERIELQSDEYYGEGPILAKNLQDEAKSGETVICEATFQQIRNLFECEVLPDRDFKNFDEPINAYRVRKEFSGAARLQRSNMRARTKLVGRRDQLNALMDRWGAVRQDGLQVVTVSGEPGIGKSRLLSAHRQHPALGKHHTVVYKCLRHYERTPYFPFGAQMEVWLGIRSEDTNEQRMEKLQSRMGAILDTAQIRVIASMFAPSPEGDRFLSAMSEDAFHEQMIAIFVASMHGLTLDRPALLHFEDAHWIDPSSMRLFRDGLARIRKLPILLVISHRPETTPDFLGDLPHTAIRLQHLSAQQARSMVRAQPGGKEMDEHTIDRIVDTTQGVPLFIEHYTQMVLDGTVKTGSIPSSDEPTSVPEKIYSLLFEQLDDAGPDKGVALAATAIGRPFDTRLLAAAAGVTPEETQPVIERLMKKGLLREARSGTELPYRFEHVLVQDAGYHSMVRQHRKTLHERIARHLAEERPELAERDPGLLARQFREAGIHDRAIAMSLKVCERALSRFANYEARNHAEISLKLLSNLPVDEQPPLRMRLQLLFGIANSALRGFGDSETLDAFQDAFELAAEMGDNRVFLRAAQGLYAAYHAHANYELAGSFGHRIREKISAKGGSLDTQYARAVADHMQGSAMIWQGAFREAHERLSKALERTGSANGAARPNAAPHQTQASLALVEAFLGNAGSATGLARKAIESARKSGTPMAIGNAMLMACNAHQILRHPDALSHAKALETFAIEQRMPFYTWGARAFIGCALYQDENRVEEGYKLLNEAWPKFQKTAARANQVFVCVERAEACRLMGRYRDGLDAIQEGLRLVEEYGERNFEAELHRLNGALQIGMGGNSATAIDSIETAREIATRQGSRLFELRALIELAELSAAGRVETDFMGELAGLVREWPADGNSTDLKRATDLVTSMVQ